MNLKKPVPVLRPALLNLSAQAPTQLTRRDLVLAKDVGPCSRCGAKLGMACASPSCPQLAPAGQLPAGPMPEVIRIQRMEKGLAPLRDPIHAHYLSMGILNGWYIMYPNQAANLWERRSQDLVLLNTNNGDRFKIELG